MSKLIVISVAYGRTIWLRSMIDSFLLQTRKDWELHIVYDGPAPEKVLDIMKTPEFKDPRIHFYESPERYERYGHPNRRAALREVKCNPHDWILLTNDDNFYTCKFWEYMSREIKAKVGMILCNTIHSHMDYNVHDSQIYECGIDMGAFLVRADIAQKVGFNHDHFSADGVYAVECHEECKRKGLIAVKVPKCLFIHN